MWSGPGTLLPWWIQALTARIQGECWDLVQALSVRQCLKSVVGSFPLPGSSQNSPWEVMSEMGAPTVDSMGNQQVFGGFEGSGGAWGHHQSTRDEKIPWGSYFREIWLEL